jgi:hypothetical protein
VKNANTETPRVDPPGRFETFTGDVMLSWCVTQANALCARFIRASPRRALPRHGSAKTRSGGLREKLEPTSRHEESTLCNPIVKDRHPNLRRLTWLNHVGLRRFTTLGPLRLATPDYRSALSSVAAPENHLPLMAPLPCPALPTPLSEHAGARDAKTASRYPDSA